MQGHLSDVPIGVQPPLRIALSPVLRDIRITCGSGDGCARSTASPFNVITALRTCASRIHSSCKVGDRSPAKKSPLEDPLCPERDTTQAFHDLRQIKFCL